jgi:hypothetical protein
LIRDKKEEEGREKGDTNECYHYLIVVVVVAVVMVFSQIGSGGYCFQ